MPTPEQVSAKLRVLVVDDSAVFRKLIAQALQALPSVGETALASDIRTARAKIEAGGIDVAIIDVTLNGECGLTLLQWMRAEYPGVMAILITAGNAAGVRTAVDALMLGAAGFVPKPQGPAALQELQDALAAVLQTAHATRARAVPTPMKALGACDWREVIAVGASTGGPPVLAMLLEGLPASFDTPILIVQHIPEAHAQYLCDLLGQRSGRQVVLGRTGMRVERGMVYLAGDGQHMTVQRSHADLIIQQNLEPAEHHCRPAVDPLFRSVAKVCGSACVGVVISGMGADGAAGATVLAAAGAPVVVQDQTTSVVWGMPGAVVACGAAAAVVPAQDLADVVVRWTTATPAHVALGGKP